LIADDLVLVVADVVGSVFFTIFMVVEALIEVIFVGISEQRETGNS
jgi:hypothetical protein